MSQRTSMRFAGPDGELSGKLHLPAGERHATAVFAHCFTCSKDLRAAVAIADTLAAHGIATLRFDFTGLGESGGDFADTTLSSNVGDLTAAANHLAQELEAPTLLIGHSLGGAAVLAAASDLPEVKAVVTVGAPADPEHVKALIADAAPTIDREGEAKVTIAGRTFRIRRSFLEDLGAHDLPASIGRLERALLVCHAPADNVVGIDNARRIFEAARHPKSFVSLDGADHLLSRPEDAAYAAEVISAWASRYVGGHRHDAPRAVTGAVRVRTDAGYATRINAAGHPLRVDEPESVGGTDTGPTPYDLLAAALGSCTSITLRMYADRKKWPLDAIEVDVRHEKKHAEDCEDCDSGRGKIDHFERVIRLDGDLDDDQRDRLLQIADRCPVHRTLHGPVHVRTRLAE